MSEVFNISSDKFDLPGYDDDIITARRFISENLEKIKPSSEVTILVVAYNKIDKTMKCLESIFKYTSNIDFDLILVDNGSSDGTSQYFETLDYEKKHIIHFTKNIGANSVFSCIDINLIGKYFVFVPNDIICTEHWLDNLLTVAKSDDRIGMVAPMSTNVSNLQQTDIVFNSLSEFQEKAAAFNRSDPTKWQERLRLITLGALLSKECILAAGWPFYDPGYVHDFADDDISFRVRRAGYKVVLAGDVVIHHNHDIGNMEGKDPVKFQQSLEMGRSNFRKKFFEVDAWDDVNNYIFPIIGSSISEPVDKNDVGILGIDVKCGQPILDIKNTIRKYGVFEPYTFAFTRDAKYYTDLKTVVDQEAICAEIGHLRKTFNAGSFDYITIGKNINEYPDYQKVIKDAYSLLKTKGQLFLTLKNVYGVSTFMTMLGYYMTVDPNILAITLDQFVWELSKLGIKNPSVICAVNSTSDNDTLDSLKYLIDLAGVDGASVSDLLNNMLVDRFYIKIVKQ